MQHGSLDVRNKMKYDNQKWEIIVTAATMRKWDLYVIKYYSIKQSQEAAMLSMEYELMVSNEIIADNDNNNQDTDSQASISEIIGDNSCVHTKNCSKK